MKMILQKVARQLSHTHTFCTILLVSVMMAGSLGVKAQGGNILFSNLTTPDPVTGMQRCTVSWNGHASIINRMNISFSFSGTFPICIDVPATLASIPAVLVPFASVTSSSVSIVNFSTVVNISSVNTPVVIHFRGEPAGALTLGLLFGTIRRDPDDDVFLVTHSSNTVTFAPGFNIFGVAQKFEGTSCSGGSNNSIPGVTFIIDRVAAGGPSCFPGGISLPTNTTPPTDFYSFDNLPANYTYNLTAAKSSGCDCGPNGPITLLDYKLARNYILGLEELSLLQAHAGDYDANGILNTIDLVLITKCHLGEPSQPSVWRFAAIDNANSFSNPSLFFVNPLPALLPPSLNVSNLTSNSRVDFIGIKRGDVDQSCSFCGGNLTGGTSEERNGEKKVFKGIVIPDISLEPGEEVLIPITAADDLTGLAVLGMEWLIGAQIELLEVKYALEGEYSNYRTRKEDQQKVLHYNWFTMTNGGEDVAAGDALLYVRIKALSKVTSLKNVLTLLPFSPNNIAFDNNGQSQVQWRLSELDKEGNVGELFVRILGANQMPGTTAQVEIYLPESGSLQIVVSDMTGRIISNQPFEALEKGWLLRKIDVPDNAGIYQLTVLSPFGQQTVRLVKY